MYPQWLITNLVNYSTKNWPGWPPRKALKISSLNEDAKNFATKKDLERFATKKDLEAVRDDVQKVEFQLKMTEQRFGQKLEDTFSKYTKEMLDKFDQVIGELQMIRKENVFQQAQFERLVERVERLEQHAGLQPLPTVL